MDSPCVRNEKRGRRLWRAWPTMQMSYGSRTVMPRGDTDEWSSLFSPVFFFATRVSVIAERSLGLIDLHLRSSPVCYGFPFASLKLKKHGAVHAAQFDLQIPMRRILNCHFPFLVHVDLLPAYHVYVFRCCVVCNFVSDPQRIRTSDA